MGLSIGLSSSSHDTVVKEICVPNPLNPDPRNFIIERVEHKDMGSHIVVQVKYPNCKNYEGQKILVFRTLGQLTNLEILDPHFSSEKPELSPIARFVPTEEGWEMAVEFALLQERAVRSLIGAAKILNGVEITEEDIYFEPNIPHFTSNQSSALAAIIDAVDAEYRRAVALHGAFSSTHEGYAIIKEEVDELWDGVKKNDPPMKLKEEAIQIAAMAIRFCIDI